MHIVEYSHYLSKDDLLHTVLENRSDNTLQSFHTRNAYSIYIMDFTKKT